MSPLDPSVKLYRETPCEHGLFGGQHTYPDPEARRYATILCNGGSREEVVIDELLGEAVTTDGGHHKQWYLERVAVQLGVELPDHEPGNCSMIAALKSAGFTKTFTSEESSTE